MFSTLTVLFALSTNAHAGHMAYLKIGDIEGESLEAEAALDVLWPTEPQAVGLLLPAVQKVREAAARAEAACIDTATGAPPEADCVADVLAADIVGSDDGGRDPALSLMDLYADGVGKTPAQAARTASRDDADGLFEGLFIGLANAATDEGMPDSVMAPIERVILLVQPDDGSTTGGGGGGNGGGGNGGGRPTR